MPFYRQYGTRSTGGLFEGAVKKIVLINVGVFILQLLLMRTSFDYYFMLIPRLVIYRGFIWQLVTYMFLHGGIFHLAFNMFIIWMFGTQLEFLWGSARFLRYYFVCGLGAAVFSFIFSFNSAVLGASGAGYGILIAYAVLFPHNQIYIWGIFPIRARTLVIILAAVNFIMGISGGTGIAYFAHLGGMAAGLLYLRSNFRTQRFWGRVRRLFDALPIKIRFGDDDAADDGTEKPTAENIDSILDKISSKGYENLTETEKRILENYSDKDTKH